MTLSKINTFLAVVLLAVLLTAATTRVDHSRPNIEVLPDMKYTPAWTAYQRNPHFTNGQTLQMPVPGTIPRGQLPLHFAASKEEAIRAGEELTNPYATADGEALRQDSVQRGGDTYRVFCIACHGPGGTGDGPVAQRGFPPPPSLLTGNSLTMKDGQVFHVLTHGQGNMSGFRGQIPADQRWDLVNYLRSLQTRTVPAEQEAEVTVDAGTESAAAADPTTITSENDTKETP